MTDDEFSKQLSKELKPELDRMYADHERFMRLVAQSSEPSEVQKQAIREANTPEGWQRAYEAAVTLANEEEPRQQRKLPLWAYAVLFVVGAVIAAVAVRLF